MTHEPNHRCVVCEDGLGALVERERQMMEEHGWYIHAVQDDKQFPFKFNAHTHGVTENFNHPDLQIVFPLQFGVINSLLKIVIDRIKEGERFEPGKRYSEICGDDYEVVFVETEEGGRKVLRMIIPDVDNGLDPSVMQSPFEEQFSDLGENDIESD